MPAKKEIYEAERRERPWQNALGSPDRGGLSGRAWPPDADSQRLTNPAPYLPLVAEACGALLAFGAAFLPVAWWRPDLE